MGGLTFKRIPATAITAGTPATVWTPASGKKFRLMGYSLGSTVAAAQAFFVEGAGNTATGIATPVLAIGGPPANSPHFGDGYLSVAADNVLKIDVSASATVAGSVWGLEE
ncbi:MAG: hypothetical protein M3P18_22195 [Actinomycetota bacterium]|nr:hypothetical protein [Actinomycetota bacterium]